MMEKFEKENPFMQRYETDKELKEAIDKKIGRPLNWQLLKKTESEALYAGIDPVLETVYVISSKEHDSVFVETFGSLSEALASAQEK
ncbi:MAG: hypothetical protein NUV49_03380 [Patescibacteria group bacterium]|nr:hypothetical protein [Patescibacteria group bacterium]